MAKDVEMSRQGRSSGIIKGDKRGGVEVENGDEKRKAGRVRT